MLIYVHIYIIWAFWIFSEWLCYRHMYNIYGLAENCGISSINALEIPQPCTKLLMYIWQYCDNAKKMGTPISA